MTGLTEGVLEKLRGRDYRFLAICAILLAASVWYATGNFYRAMPEASIDFRIGRDEAARQARQILPTLGFHAAGYREASSFTFDDAAKTFLERELGLERANQLMGSRIRMWRWSFRWFRPQQKEEFRIDLTTTGELVGFNHEIPEDLALPTLSEPTARALAEDLLRNRMHRPLESLEFVELSEQVRPHRTDRLYTWKERDFNIHDADYRVQVEIDGEQVAQYREYLHIPEQWTRDYQLLRSKNEAAGAVDLAFMALLMAGLVVTIVVRLRRQDIRWRRSAWIGIIGMVLAFLSHLNQFPIAEFGFPTTDTYSSFLFGEIFRGVLSALGVGGFLFVIAAGAETLYRESMPGKISIANLFRPRGLRTRSFFLNACLGIALTGIFVAYQTLFYLTAQHFGAWSPADVPYDDLLNTRFPWLFVLFGGFFPAVFEEFVFRMFAIPFLRRILRGAIIPAVVLAGFIWGFGHTTYPNQPFYIRGIEVGIGGVALGFVMLRFGVLPTLIWHYSVDAMYSAMLLLRSQNLYLKLSGAASAGIIMLPAIVALIAYLTRGGFEPETGLLNADDVTGPVAEIPPELAAAIAAPERRSLGAPLRLAAAALFLIGMLALWLPGQRFGETPRYRLTEDQALNAATSYAASIGIDTRGFMHVTYADARWDEEDALAARYFLQRLPLPAASQMFAVNRPLHIWTTRYFKPLDREELIVAIDPETGKPLGFHHALPEDRPGANLTPDAARQLAADFAASQGRSTAGMILKLNSSEKRKARTDYSLQWEAPPGDPRSVDQAHYRIAVDVDGGQVASLRGFWDLPEAFTRFRNSDTLATHALTALRVALASFGLVWAIGMLVRYVRRDQVKWRPVLRIAAMVTTATAVGAVMSLRLVLRNYRTEMPLERFQLMQWIGLGTAVLFAFLMMAAAVALVACRFPASLKVFSRESRRAHAVDALTALAAVAGLGLLWRFLDAFLLVRFHTVATVSAGTPSLIGTAIPSIAALASALQTVPEAAAVAAIVSLIVGWLRKPWLAALLVPLAALFFVPGSVRTGGEFALAFGGALVAVGLVAGVCLAFLRDNYLAYALLPWAFALSGSIVQCVENPMPGLWIHAAVLGAVLGLSLLWMALPALRSTPEG
jgi:membrane protease YdiL (CAAX protease family)